MFFAAVSNKLECAKFMFSKGAKCDTLDTLYNQTPIFYAAREGHTEMCKFLIGKISQNLNKIVNQSISQLINLDKKSIQTFCL